MNFSEALKAMKSGKTVKRKDKVYSYFFDGSFWLTAKVKEINQYDCNPIFNNIDWQQESIKLELFIGAIYAEDLIYFDDTDLLAEDWEIVDVELNDVELNIENFKG